MFNLRRLLVGAVALPAADVADAERFAQQTINKVRGRVIRARGPTPSQACLRLSQDPAGLDALRNELLLNSDGHKVPAAIHAIALRELFLQPACVLPIATTAADPDNARTVGLLGFFRTSETTLPLMLRSFVQTGPADRKGVVSISIHSVLNNCA